MPSKLSKTRRSPDALDREIGARVRRLRGVRGRSLAEISTKIGVSVQQAQKYETGESRISAGRLQEIANALDVPVALFFSSTENSRQFADAASNSSMVLGGLSPVKAAFIQAVIASEDKSLEAVKSFFKNLAGDAN